MLSIRNVDMEETHDAHIAHGEADVRHEWWTVRVGLFLMGLFIAATLMTLAKVRRAAG